MGTFKNIQDEAEKFGKELEEKAGAKTVPEKVGATVGKVVGGAFGLAWNATTSASTLVTKGVKAADANFSKMSEDIEEASILGAKVGKQFSILFNAAAGATASVLINKALQKQKEQNKSNGQNNNQTKRLKS